MAVLSSLVSSAARLKVCRRHFWQLAAFNRTTRLSQSLQRSCSSETAPPAEYFSSGTERYKVLKEHFSRSLKATYRRFSDIQGHSVVCGHNHVYFIEDDGIYRMDRSGSEQRPEQVLNLAQASKEHNKTRTGSKERKQRSQWTVQRIRLSPQEKHLAATLKCSHGEELRCVVVKLGERNLLHLDPQHIIITLEKVLSFEWATDEVLFYTTLEGLRSSKVFRLDLTSGGDGITSVYEETQPDMFVEVALSRDRQALTINCSSRTSSEVLLCDVRMTHLEPSVVQPRNLELLYYVEHWRKWLIILANTGPGQEYQVVQAPVSEPSMASWASVFTPGPGTAVRDMDVVGDHCVLVARTPTNELSLIVVPLAHPKEAYAVQLPFWACAIETKSPGLADQHRLEFLISSPVHEPVPYSLCPDNGLLQSGTGNGSTTKKEFQCITKRFEACSQDGTLVPVTLFHAVPVERLSQTPLLVHVYGAYGRDLNMDFCPEKRMLVEQGWALAYCHIRGGGERGLSWHRGGCVEGKEKGVKDLQACLQHLFSSGVSSPSLTAVTACSAGAVPVGVLCNRHPDMMQAVALQSPFLDVLGTMEDPSQPLTLEDRDEWGDPVGNPEHKKIITSYCPVANITPKHYPSMLLTAYSSDPRVPLAGVLKYAERLKAALHTFFSVRPRSERKPAPNIVLNIQPGQNHLGPEDFEQMVEEESLKLAFLYTELGLDLPQLRRPQRKRKK